jgi:pimeloyl-ACP methyl ester carboxylesterase
MRRLLLAILFILAAIGLAFVNHSSQGILGFYAWKQWQSQAETGHAEVNGVTIYYEVYGEGPPVLVLHGGSASIETMHYQIRELAVDHQVIAADSRAHGRSTDADGIALSYNLMADDMVSLLDKLEIERADVFGWSDGGNIGLNMAIRFPERVRRLVMYGSNFHHTGLSTELSDHELRNDPNHAEWDDARSFYISIAPSPERWPILHEKLIAMWESQPTWQEEDLLGLSAPTLVMAGEFDLVTEEHTRKFAALIPEGTAIILSGQDHFAPLVAPDLVTPHVASFLRR